MDVGCNWFFIFCIPRQHLHGSWRYARLCNGMAGHTAICGDCFSLIKGACATLQKGKAQYYPISPLDNAKKEYNPAWPIYSFENLPIWTQSQYWNTIQMLSNAKTKKDTDQIVRTTGISCLPLCTASPAFIHPTFSLLILFIYFMKIVWHLFGICGFKVNQQIHFTYLNVS